MTAGEVRALRERTGQGLPDCREMVASLSQRVEKLESLGSPKDALACLRFPCRSCQSAVRPKCVR